MQEQIVPAGPLRLTEISPLGFAITAGLAALCTYQLFIRKDEGPRTIRMLLANR